MGAKNYAAVIAMFSVIAFFAGCAGKVDISIQPSGAARLRSQATIDAAVMRELSAKMASFSGKDAPKADAPMFDAAAVKEAMKGRKDIVLESVEVPEPNTMKTAFTVASLAKMGSKNGEPSPFFSIKSSGGQKTLSFRLDRQNVARLPELVPSMDSSVFELLAPPSLYGDDIGEKDYRDNSLALFVGAKNLAAVDKAGAEIRITPPGKIVSQTGGRVEDNSFVAVLPLLTVLVLEKPFEFTLTWKE